jgi:hypothetical protein
VQKAGVAREPRFGAPGGRTCAFTGVSNGKLVSTMTHLPSKGANVWLVESFRAPERNKAF